MKRILPTALSIILACCSSTKPIQLTETQLNPIPVGAQEQTIKQKRENLLEEILEQNPCKHIKKIIYYEDENKDTFCKLIEQEYNATRAQSTKLWHGLATRQEEYAALTLSSRQQTAQGKQSICVIFPKLFQIRENKEDILSCIVDHEYIHAKDNFEGIILCNEKITNEIIKKIKPLNYQDILELRAYSHQLEQIEKGKRKTSKSCKKEAIYKYTEAYIRVRDQKNKYANQALKQAPYFPFPDIPNDKLLLYRKENLPKIKEQLRKYLKESFKDK
ncbi:hypothetical protein GF358_04635 [Candidatus Woesearchaeota archaeon]|nr:hypothetical protein [Candidatus Woesearchaeota archaeon]